MKNYGMKEEKDRRMAVKDLTRVSEKIRDKKQARLRIKQQLQKIEADLEELNKTFEKSLVTIHGTMIPKMQNTRQINKEGES